MSGWWWGLSTHARSTVLMGTLVGLGVATVVCAAFERELTALCRRLFRRGN